MKMDFVVHRHHQLTLSRNEGHELSTMLAAQLDVVGWAHRSHDILANRYRQLAIGSFLVHTLQHFLHILEESAWCESLGKHKRLRLVL